MDPLVILIFLVLFFLSAFFSGTEIALMWLSEHKIESFLKQDRFWAKALKYIKEHNDKLLITILIWNNLVNVYIAALATQISIIFAQNSWFEQAFAVWIATWVITFLLLIFWEITPKSFATKNSTKISLLVAPIYKVLMYILYPVVVAIELLIKIFTWTKVSDTGISDEEIESFIDMWKTSWTLEDHEHEKIKNVLEFSDTPAEEIMTPRVKIEAFREDTTVWEAIKFYMEHTHSRLPVYKDRIDDIYSFVTIRDLLNESKSKKLKDIELHEILKIPLNQPIDNLFKSFQRSRKHLAMVMDEYGWVAWLITLEDVVEEIFWEIRDETDVEVDEIKENWENSFIVKPWVLIEDLLEKVNLTFSDIDLDEKEFDWETMSYVITHKLERFPEEWEEIFFDSKLLFKVLSAKDAEIGDIEVKKL